MSRSLNSRTPSGRRPNGCPMFRSWTPCRRISRTLKAQLSQRDEQLTTLAAKAEAELAAANERTAAADVRAVGAEARGAGAEARADKADARADTLIAELAGANERAIAAAAGRDEADARADRLVADLNSLAVRMAEVLAHQLGEPGEPEPLPWWGRAWRRVVGG